MEDLYPGSNWSYVFGWANYRQRTGVFSFVRYTAEVLHEDIPDPAQELLFNACHVMVHEAGHMFGMTHCTYYECTMNGFNSREEQMVMNRCKCAFTNLHSVLCPVCLRKLQSVIGFNVKGRFQALLAVCNELGFADSAAYYEKMLKL